MLERLQISLLLLFVLLFLVINDAITIHSIFELLHATTHTAHQFRNLLCAKEQNNNQNDNNYLCVANCKEKFNNLK